MHLSNTWPSTLILNFTFEGYGRLIKYVLQEYSLFDEYLMKFYKGKKSNSHDPIRLPAIPYS